MSATGWEIRRSPVGQSDMNIILCDDDPAFLTKLHQMLSLAFHKLNMKAVICTFSSPADILSEQYASCDMAFLDIDFDSADRNGLDIARMLRQLNDRALIFFVTNYIDYAPAGYEVQAFRYILKRDIADVLERYILQAVEKLAENREYLRLDTKEQLADIAIQQISYLEVMDHSVSIYTAQTKYTIASTLSGFEKALEPYGFLRIHKSYLVNMAHIRKFRSSECLLSNGTALAVSEKNYSQQKQKYLLWKGFK